MTISQEQGLAYWWPQDGTCPPKNAKRVRTLATEKRKQRSTEKETRNGDYVKNTLGWFTLPKGEYTPESLPVGLMMKHHCD